MRSESPLREAFGIDLTSYIFGAIDKLFALARPAMRTPLVSWSLDKVLNFLASQENESFSPKDFLQKTLFLVTLAMGV